MSGRKKKKKGGASKEDRDGEKKRRQEERERQQAATATIRAAQQVDGVRRDVRIPPAWKAWWEERKDTEKDTMIKAHKEARYKVGWEKIFNIWRASSYPDQFEATVREQASRYR